MKTSTLLTSLLSGARNLLPNSVWAGGGTLPTGWAGISTGTAAPYATATDGRSTSYRITAVAQRPLFTLVTALPVVPNSSYTFSTYVDAILGGSFTLFDVIVWASYPAGSSLIYMKNDVEVASSTAIAAGDRIGCVLVTGATGGTANPRVGLGINTPATGDFVFSRPQAVVGPSMRRYRATT